MKELEVKENLVTWLENNYPDVFRKYRFISDNAERKEFLLKAVLFRIKIEPDYVDSLPISVIYKVNQLVKDQPESVKPEFRHLINAEEYTPGTDEKIDALADKLVKKIEDAEIRVIKQ